MTTTTSAIKAVSVIATGAGEAHHEHVYGSRKPALWWIFFGRRRVRLPINVYVIEHHDGLVLFDAGADPAVVTDPATTATASPHSSCTILSAGTSGPKTPSRRNSARRYLGITRWSEEVSPALSADP